MSWPILAATTVGLVVGINLGVLLMVALQAGRRQDDAYGERVLRTRITELETALAQQVGRPGASDPYVTDLNPVARDSSDGGGGKATATG